ncbi:hypothetical protein GCM10008018_45800 [Paenibacillus marchantiophytorum]|uniref:Uncharacterized protein n=1 Tax=Paenibacillus marchantiophytorum TaxID=1619310 RepID=A0ABQ1EZ51_9BACL|nr:hypothetical protein [Paenibacillus marchantiophytorum]GFZ94191.1 hypothetical protein GCM10008018_45800 [Paenibacillus marchantiophytorum]
MFNHGLKKLLTVGLIASSLVVTAQSAFATSPYVEENETYNNNINTPTSFSWGQYATGYIESSSDSDWWSFYADANQGGRPVTLVLNTPQNKDYRFTAIDSIGSRPDNFTWGTQQNGLITASFTLRANTTYKFRIYGTGPDDFTPVSGNSSDKYYLSVN